MPPDTPPSLQSPSDRREYYRITVTLPICLQRESSPAEPTPVQRAVNLSAGGIGVTLNETFQTNEILVCTLLLPDNILFKSYLEVLRHEPLPSPPNTYRLHACFLRMTTDNREQLVRYILQFQREHLARHYSV